MQEPTSQRGWFAHSYVGRHWRGEQSLAYSYFVNGLVGFIAGIAVSTAVTAAFSDHYEPLSGFVAVAGVWLCLFVIMVWQVVGVWRSANRHVSRGGRGVWAGLAKVMIVLGVISTASSFAERGWPQIAESYHILAGDPTVGDYRITLLNAGSEIEFSGGIRFGATEALRQILDAAHEVQVVHLDSQGGRVAEARAMRALIRERGLITYVRGSCLSACTIAYLGGVQRHMHPSATFGFHAGSFPGVTAQEMHGEDELAAAEAAALGVSLEFATKAFLTPAEDMWYPTVDVLLDADFVHRVEANHYALSGFGARPSHEAVAAGLTEIPLYATISKAEPAVFATIAAKIHDGILNGTSEATVQSEIQWTISKLVEKYLPRASDEALLSMLAVMIEQLETIGAASPETCHDYLFPPEGRPPDVWRFLSPEQLAREFKASEMTISSGIAGHRTPISEAEAGQLMAPLFQRVAEKYDSSILERMSKLGTSEMRKAETCDVALVVFREVAALPLELQPRLMQYLTTKQGETDGG